MAKAEDAKHASKPSQAQPEKEDMEKRAQNAVGEGRMIVPGIQALFGFQLIAVFNPRFPQLPSNLQLLHFSALLLLATAIGLIMAPAAYHRIVEQSGVSKFFVQYSSSMIAASMLPLLLAITFDVYVLGHLVLENDQASFWVAAFLGALLAILWFILPFTAKVIVRQKRENAG